MSDANCFTQFGLPLHLHIDLPALEKSFYAASSALNDAYRTLRDPISRTEYLLSLEGIQLEEQSRAATDAAKASGTAKKQVAPPDLLEEAFELNMALEELKMGDDPDARQQLEAARTKFTAMLTETQTELEALWTKWDNAIDSDDATAREATKAAMVALLNRRSYVRNLVRDVNTVLE
jgi:molecular chaperone HscB